MAFQEYILELKGKGIVLAVVSKNNEADAREVFLKHPDMRLRLEDLAVFAVNWDDKPYNLRRVAQDLNLGLDSLARTEAGSYPPRVGTVPACVFCPLSRQVVLTEMDGVEELVIELLPTVSAPVDLRLTKEGRTVVSTTMGADRVARVAGPFSGSVAIELRPLDLVAAESVASPSWRPCPVVRRLMTEARDQAAPLRHRA